MDGYIEVGLTALRDPATGGFLPAVPLYIKADDSTAAAQQSLIDDLGKLFAARMRQYLDGVPSMADNAVSDAVSAASGAM